MTGKTQESSGAGPDEPRSFEQSLAELQTIVGELQDGALGLEESMSRFEQGMKLLRECYAILEHAEGRIEMLTRIDDDGTVHTEPFDATATIEKNRGSASSPASETTGTDETGESEHPASRLF